MKFCSLIRIFEKRDQVQNFKKFFNPKNGQLSSELFQIVEFNTMNIFGIILFCPTTIQSNYYKLKKKNYYHEQIFMTNFKMATLSPEL